MTLYQTDITGSKLLFMSSVLTPSGFGTHLYRHDGFQHSGSSLVVGVPESILAGKLEGSLTTVHSMISAITERQYETIVSMTYQSTCIACNV